MSAFWDKKGKRSSNVHASWGKPSLRLRSSASLTGSECPVLGLMSKVGDESHRRALLVGKEFCKERWLLC